MKKQISSKEFKSFAVNLLLAQTASDSGKGYQNNSATNVEKAAEKAYGAKDVYIKSAIGLAKKIPQYVTAGINDDENNDMTVILFNIKNFGQVSFHTFKDYNYLNLPLIEWNGISFGSIKTCQKLSRKLNLPHYKYKGAVKKNGKTIHI